MVAAGAPTLEKPVRLGRLKGATLYRSVFDVPVAGIELDPGATKMFGRKSDAFTRLSVELDHEAPSVGPPQEVASYGASLTGALLARCSLINRAPRVRGPCLFSSGRLLSRI
jgi:hypothetical protein